jgi:uncharacterized protein with FMN-binding domain
VVSSMSPVAKVLMSVLTAVALGVSLRFSAHGQPPVSSAAPAGVVGVAHRAPTRSASPAPAPSGTPTRMTHKTRSRPPSRPVTQAPSKAAPTQVTVNGGAADTMYGPVQVQITVRGAQIVSAHAIAYPQGGGRDQQINSYAIPQLDQEVLRAQSARIDTVSGATFTSDGYRRSLQSAIDAAHQASR